MEIRLKRGNGRKDEVSDISPKFVKERNKAISPINWTSELFHHSDISRQAGTALSKKRGSLAPEHRRGITPHQLERLTYFDTKTNEERLFSPQLKPAINLNDYVKMKRERDFGNEMAEYGEPGMYKQLHPKSQLN